MISQSNDSSYSGKVDSVDQGATIPVEVITVNGDSVHLELKSVEASFEGKLNADRTEMPGQFSQRGGVLPLTLNRRAESGSQASDAKPSTAERPMLVRVDVAVP